MRAGCYSLADVFKDFPLPSFYDLTYLMSGHGIAATGGHIEGEHIVPLFTVVADGTLRFRLFGLARGNIQYHGQIARYIVAAQRDIDHVA